MDDKEVLVTFKRRRLGQIHQVGFECGAQNADLILKEAWNTNSMIMAVEPLPARLRRTTMLIQEPAIYCGTCGGKYGDNISVEAEHVCPGEDDEAEWCEPCGAELTDNGTCDNDHEPEEE